MRCAIVRKSRYIFVFAARLNRGAGLWHARHKLCARAPNRQCPKNCTNSIRFILYCLYTAVYSSMRVPKKEGISREEREKMWEGSSSLGVFATRISARRHESRACGANFGHVGRISDISDVLAFAKFEMSIFFGKGRRISGHLGPQGASRGTSRSPRPGSESGTRLTGGVGRSLAHL